MAESAGTASTAPLTAADIIVRVLEVLERISVKMAQASMRMAEGTVTKENSSWFVFAIYSLYKRRKLVSVVALGSWFVWNFFSDKLIVFLVSANFISPARGRRWLKQHGGQHSQRGSLRVRNSNGIMQRVSSSDEMAILRAQQEDEKDINAIELEKQQSRSRGNSPAPAVASPVLVRNGSFIEVRDQSVSPENQQVSTKYGCPQEHHDTLFERFRTKALMTPQSDDE